MARKKNSGSWLLLLLGFVAGIGAAVVLFRYMGFEMPPERPAAKPPVAHRAPAEPAPPVEPQVAAPETGPVELVPPLVVTRPARPRLAIIIDDMGPDLRKMRELLDVGGPVTVAVMPNQRYSGETSTLAASRGLDVIVHMPMEPRETAYHNPGSDALLVAMTPGEIRAKFEEGLMSVPGAIGVNNHMGSKFTEDEIGMREVLKVVKNRDMLFIDSRTTSKSVAGRLAREFGVPSADRNVFLDNTRDVEYIKGQLREAARFARQNGRAVAIGHPYPETIKALKEAVPGLAAEGIEVVGISELVGPKR